MRHSKKGSLELSVNAIVILVMAIAILGLGLAFIRGALSKGQAQVFKAIDNAQLENPASADTPATVDKNVQVKNDGTAQVSLGFYNKETATAGVTFTPVISTCSKGGVAADNFDLISGAQAVGVGKASGYQGIVQQKATVLALNAGDAYVCTVEFRTSAVNPTTAKASAQFFITVIS